MNAAINLLPCPMCGGAAKFECEEQGYTAFLNVGCTACYAKGPVTRFHIYHNGLIDTDNGREYDPAPQYKTTAAEAWNRRATPAKAEPSDALELIAESWDGCLHDGADIGECLREEFSRIRGQQCGVSDAADRVRLNWIEDQSDFGPIEITLGKGTRPNTTATYLTYGADDGSRISSGPARHVRAAIDQCKNPDAAIQAQAGDAPTGGAL